MSRSRRAAALAALVLAASAARAATKNYVGPDNGSFSTAANWSPSGVPANGDDVVLGANVPSGFNGSLHATIGGTFPSTGQLSSLTLNSSASGITFMVVNQTSGSLNVANVNVGTTILDNTFNQSGGSDTFSKLQVGVNAGTTNNTYSVSGASTTLTSAQAVVGVAGTGTFTQSAGTVSLTGQTYMVLGQSASATGTYNLSGGFLTVGYGDGYVGQNGTGIFNQTGGTALFTFLEVQGANSAYNFGGGGLGAYTITVSAGATFNFQNGASTGSEIDPKGGTILISGDGSSQGAMNFGGGGGTLKLNGHSFTAGEVLGGPADLIENGGSSAATFSFYTFGDVSAHDTFYGRLIDGGTGPLGVTLLGTGAYTFSNTANTYTGPTTITGGVLDCYFDLSLSSLSTVVLSGGQLLLETADTQLVGALGGSGGSVEMKAGANLIIGGNNSNASTGAAINGLGTLSKTGIGTQTLTGGGTFTGVISVLQGGLTAGAVNGIPTGATVSMGYTGALNIAANQSLSVLFAAPAVTINLSNNATLTLGTGNVDDSVSGNFGGAGTIIQTGTGTLTVGGGAGDTVANTGSSVTLGVTSGNVVLSKAPGTTAVAGAIRVGGGTLSLAASNLISDSSQLSITGGTFNMAGFADTVGNLTGNSGTLAVNLGALGVNQTSAGSFSGNLAGQGSFTKLGAADLTLSSVSAYTGTFAVNAGRLILQGPLGATGYSIAAGATLRFSSTTVNVGYGAIQPSSGATVEYSGSTVNGGNLDGPGAHTLLAGAAFNGTTAQPGAVLNQTGASTLTNFSNNGTVNNNAPLTWTYGVNNFAGTLNVNSILATTGFASAGIINVATNGAITNTTLPLTLGGGSRTYLGTSNVHGGTLTLSGGTTLEVNGGLLVNNGTINGTVNVNYGALAKGSGVYSTLNVNDGGKFSPGNSPGSVTTGPVSWNGGGAYQVEIYDAAGAAGTGYDTWNINGDLTLGAGQTTNSKFVIALTSLSTPTTSGQAIHFNPAVVNTWQIATVTGQIAGFDPSRFTLDTSAFLNPLPNTAFMISKVGQSLYVSNGPPSITVPTTLSAGQVRLTTLAVAGTAILDAGSAHASEIDSLVITPDNAGGYQGTVDLIDSDLLLHTGTVASVSDEVRAWYDGGARDGRGLGASYANPNTPAASLLSLGVIPNADGRGLPLYPTFDGLPSTTTDILVRFTYLGDTDLSGSVDANDLANLLAGVNGALTGWLNGDLNYDGQVDAADLSLLLTSLRNQGAPFTNPGSGPSNAVPEPALALTLLPPTLLLKRRRP